MQTTNMCMRTHHHAFIATDFFALIVHRFNGMIPLGHTLSVAR